MSSASNEAAASQLVHALLERIRGQPVYRVAVQAGDGGYTVTLSWARPDGTTREQAVMPQTGVDAAWQADALWSAMHLGRP